MKVLLTGHTGILGSRIYESLKSEYEITLLARQSKSKEIFFNINSINETKASLKDVSTVVHCAAINVNKYDNHPDHFHKSRSFNVDFTLKLLEFAEEAGVKKFIYISTGKVYGEYSFERPFKETDKLKPEGNYAKSKAIADEKIQNFCKDKAIKFVIIRPPIILDNSSKANSKMLYKLAESQLPLPFKNFDDYKRSIITINNLISFINICIQSKKSNNEVFNIAEADDYTFAELLRLIASQKKKQMTLFKFPIWSIRFLLSVFKKQQLLQKIYNPFQLDCSNAKNKLDWKSGKKNMKFYLDP